MPPSKSRAAARGAETTRTRAAAHRAHRPAPAPARECVLYARVSSKDQEKEGFSIPSQLRLLREYAERQGFTVVQEFVDVETAKRAGRTHFTEMLGVLRERASCRTILVEKTDRLYRNITDWVTLDALHLDIHLVKEGTVLSEGSRSSEKFIHGIKVLMAKNYIDNLSEETRKGMFEKVQQGIWPGPAPLGYNNVRRPDGKNVIEVDLEVAPKVIELFQRYASGDTSLAALAKHAESIGLRSRKGNKLGRSAIQILLKNPLFIGEFDWHGTTYQAAHQPLVSRELRERVLVLMGERAQVSRATQYREFAFSGLLDCAWCASEGNVFLLVGEIHKEKYVYYACQECKRRGRGIYHREPDIEAAFLGALKQLWIDPEVLDELRTALRASHAELLTARNRAVGRIQTQIDTLQTRLDRAYDDRLDGRLSIDEYERRANGWRDEQTRLRRELDAHAGADQATMEQGIALLELATTMVRLWERQDATAKRKILSYLCSNSVFGEEGLVVNWREPFDQLAESVEGPEDTNGRECELSAERPLWLPGSAPVDSRADRANMLVSWEVRAELPPNRGYGLRRHPVPEKAEVKQRQRRLARDMKRAGQTKDLGEGGSTANGPADPGAGQATGPTVDPWADALARVRGRLAKARAWRGWIDAVPDRTAADLAKRERRTRARVSQVLRLLDLAPAIVEDLERDDRTGPVPSELQLRSIAAIGSVEQQWRRYEQLVRQGDLSMGRRKGEPVARSHGFRADLERARRFQELWDTGAYVSLKELGRLEGITGARVSQLMNLLHLAPEILAVLDVPEEQVPASVMKKEVRAIARLRTHAEQVVAFEGCCPGVLGSVAAK